MSDNPQPICAGKAPLKLDAEAGKTYYWCACGRSASQPLCDGSHKGCGIAPQAFTAEKDGPLWLCNCKATKGAPICDGSHSKL